MTDQFCSRWELHYGLQMIEQEPQEETLIFDFEVDYVGIVDVDEETADVLLAMSEQPD